MNKSYLILGASTIGAAGAGFYGGYRWAMRKFYRSYEEVLADEVQKTKEFYSNLYKDEYPTPADAVASLGAPSPLLEDATVALRKYANITVKPEDLEDPGSIVGTVRDGMHKAVVESVEIETERRNIFEQDQPDLLNRDGRDLDKPYIVSLDEYMDHPEGHDEIQLTFYAGDSVLGDDQDEPINDTVLDDLVGRSNLELFGVSDPDDPHILLIRNHAKKLDIEITHSDGKFAYEVLGLNHSDEPAPRRRPRWDDE